MKFFLSQPENVLLDTKTNQIKLIDFGASRELDVNTASKEEEEEDPDLSCSPEFLAPEVISRGPLGTYTDMWSFGVLLYVSLSGLSPFLDDSDDQTTGNILRCDFSFPEEYFSSVSPSAKDLVSRLLRADPSSRASASAALASPWISGRAAAASATSMLSSLHLATLVRRRLKKLNAVAPASLASRVASAGRLASAARPESLYRTQPPLP